MSGVEEGSGPEVAKWPVALKPPVETIVLDGDKVKPGAIMDIGRQTNMTHKNFFGVDENTVSGKHCQLEYKDGKVLVRDYGGKRGTTGVGRRVRWAQIWDWEYFF